MRTSPPTRVDRLMARGTPRWKPRQVRGDQPVSRSYVRRIILPRELVTMFRQGFHGSYRVLVGAVALLTTAGGAGRAQRQMASPRIDQQLAPLRVIDATMIDTAAKACRDFFQFANG